MGMPLEKIMELKFNLKYHLNVSFEEFDTTELTELLWIANRLKQQLTKERSPKTMTDDQ